MTFQILKKNKRVLIASAYLFALCFLALFAPFVTKYSYDEQNIADALMSPGWRHWFGTDSLGRDLYSRVLYGARISLLIGFFSAYTSFLIGVFYGSLSAYFGGKIDLLMMRLVDIFDALPSILLSILIMLVVGRGPLGIFFSISLIAWLNTARIVRAEVLKAKEMLYVEAARSIGLPRLRILQKHIFPNIMSPVLLSIVFAIPQNILAESFLSFIGIGIEPPYASWGTLANEGWRALDYPHLSFFPGIVLFLTIYAFQLIAEALKAPNTP